MAKHNHATRDIKAQGICPACDAYWKAFTQPGDRVRAVRFDVPEKAAGRTPDENGLIRDDNGDVLTIDDNVTVPPGTVGIVQDIDDGGTLHVYWANGRRLGLVPGQDEWEVVS